MGRYIKPWIAKRDMRKTNQRPWIGNPSFDFLDHQKTIFTDRSSITRFPNEKVSQILDR